MLDGPGVDAVRRLVDEAMECGTVLTHPIPTVYDIRDPLHSERDMALILSAFWVLPPELDAHFPEVPDEDEAPGVVN